MRNSGMGIVKNVYRASTPIVINETVATYNVDGSSRVTLVDENASLEERVSMVVNPYVSNAVILAIRTLLDTDTFEIPTDVLAHLELTSKDIVNMVDVSTLTYTPVSGVSPSDSTVTIVGYYWNRPKNGSPFKRAVRVNYYGTDIELPCNRGGALVFKSYSVPTMWGLLKRAFAAYALEEAEQLTHDANTANTYHHVKYKMVRMDVGEAC